MKLPKSGRFFEKKPDFRAFFDNFQGGGLAKKNGFPSGNPWERRARSPAPP